MRRATWGRVALGLALIVVLPRPVPVVAQSGQRGPGLSLGGFELIGVPAVQAELKMDQTQVGKAGEMAKRMKARTAQDMGKLRGLKSDEQAKRMATLAPPHYEEGMKQLRAFLRPEQVERFDQILLQQRGPAALLEPKIAQAVQVTNEQAVRIAQLLADAQAEQKAVARSTGGNPTPEGLAKFRAIADKTYAQVDEVLKPEQQRTWKRIVGEPFYPDTKGAAEVPAGEAPKR